jgi:hypothetical protein
VTENVPAAHSEATALLRAAADLELDEQVWSINTARPGYITSVDGNGETVSVLFAGATEPVEVSSRSLSRYDPRTSSGGYTTGDGS